VRAVVQRVSSASVTVEGQIVAAIGPGLLVLAGSMLRLGARATHGAVRVDGAFLIGVTEHDPSWGFSTGLTWVFRGFTVP